MAPRLVLLTAAIAARPAFAELKLEVGEDPDSKERITFGPIVLQREGTDRLTSSGTYVAPDFKCASGSNARLCEENQGLNTQLELLNASVVALTETVASLASAAGGGRLTSMVV